VTVDDDSREQGVEFGPLADDLTEQEYPMSKETLLSTFGDREIELEDATTTLRELIEPLGQDTFESADAVEQSLLNMVGDEAIGRKDYTDRAGRGESDDESV
jgi:hypothetical protein